MTDTSTKPKVTQQAPTVITALVLTSRPLVNGKPPKKTFMKVEIGEETTKTSDFITASGPPEWTTNIVVNNLGSITSIQFSLYARKHFGRKTLLASTEVAIDAFLPSNKELSVPFIVAPSEQSGALAIRYETNVEELLASSSAPTEGFDPSKLSTGKDVTEGVVGIASEFSFLDSILPFKEMFDRLAQVHPMASAAWSLLTLGLDILEAQYAKDKGIVDLHKAMIHTFEIANEKDVVRDWDILQSTFDVMIKQIIECHIFISGYAPKSYLRRLVQLDVSKKTAEFRQGFVDLEAQFKDKMNRGVAVVTIGTHEVVQEIEQDTVLARLKPPHGQLRPPEKCLLGTRIEPISYIISWIVDMNGELMFITGFPGTGKSTLMSSIADASRHMGAQSRLGAYIRFNRKLMNDASTIIATIAYRLASFDKRIKEAISTAVKKHPEFEEMPLHEQFKTLLLDPLRSVEELLSEGPIVVLVDALDECEASETRTEFIKVLAGGFGTTLPFMRLIITSRAVADITNVFDAQKMAHIHPYSLDHMAKETDRDIRLYFTERFRQLENDAFNELWTRRNAIEELTKRACGLFIWAFTTYTFIKDYPSSRLLVILETDGPTEPEAALDTIYQIALGATLTDSGSNSDIKADMRSVLGAISVMVTPPGLVPSAIDGLLFHGGLPKSQDILRKLACVIISESSQYPLRFIHTSLHDFLINKQRSGDSWHIDIAHHNKEITIFCLCTLGTHFNQIAPDSVAYTSSTDINAIRALGNAHSYACQFWIAHLSKLDPKDQDLDRHLRVFFQKHFLKWLQSMSALNLSNIILSLLGDFLQHTNKGSCSAADRALRYDAFQFAEQFYADIKEDPLSVISTGLTFCGDSSSLHTLYRRSEATPTVTGLGYNRLLALSLTQQATSATFFPDGSKFVSTSLAKHTVNVWDAHTGAPIFDAMKGHANGVLGVRVSPDGLKIVSMGFDCEIIIWDALTGRQIMGPLDTGHQHPGPAADFSPDSSKIVTAGGDGCIRIWDALTGLPVIEPILAHDEAIEDVVFSPDGTRILSGGDDSTIRMWDAVTGASLFEPIHLEGIVMSVAFSPDGSKVISGSADSLVQVWDSATGISILEPIRGHKNVVSSAAFSNDGTKIISGSWDNTIRVWDSATGDLLAQPILERISGSTIFAVQFSPDDARALSVGGEKICIRDVSTIQGIATLSSDPFQLWNLAMKQLLRCLEVQYTIHSVAFSSSGANFISGGWDNTIKVWDAATSLLILPPILGHTSIVSSVSYSPSGQLIASGSYDATIRLWDAHTGDPVNEPFCGHDDAITTGSFSSDGSRIVSASYDHTIRVWDVASGKESFDALRHDSIVHTATFSPDDTIIISGSDDQTVRIWDASTGAALHDPLCAHVGPVMHVAWSPNGEMFASASQDGTVKLWHFTSAEVIREFQIHAVFHCVKFWPNGQKILASSGDGKVYAWDVSTAEPVFEPIHAHTGVTYADLSPDGTKILTGSIDKTLRVWDATNGAPLSAPIEIHNPVTSLCRNAEVMVVGAANNTIHVWSTSTMTMPYEPLSSHKAIVLSLSLDPKNSRLVSGSKDRSFVVWDLVKGELLYRVQDAHAEMLTSVAFSPDGSKIATGSADHTIKLWDVSGGEALLHATMTGHDDRIASVAFSSDGLHLVSASLDHTIRLWDASTGAPIFVTNSANEPLDKVVFSTDGKNLIYASASGVVYKWPFRASLLTSSSMSTEDVSKRVPLSQSEVFVKFPREMHIATTYMTDERFYAVMTVTNQLITVDLC